MKMLIFGMKLICHGQNCLATYVSGEDVLCETDKPSNWTSPKLYVKTLGPWTLDNVSPLYICH